MNYLRQIYYEMRHHKMMTWVSISGTALAIFLVMSFITAENIKTIDMAPETSRSRIMLGQNVHIESLGSDMNSNTGSSSGINPEFAKRVYGNLEGVESVSYMSCWDDPVDANVKGEETITVTRRKVDQNFWKVYNFNFIDGRPYDEAECKADAKMVVITRSTARKLFGEEKVAGREIEIRTIPYTVVGVVEDVSPLLSKTFAHVYAPYDIDQQTSNKDWFGETNVRLRLKEGVDPEDVKKEVERIYTVLNSEAKKEGVSLIYHDQPYTAVDVAAGIEGSNQTPPTGRDRKIHWWIYSILVLLPAINLSSMTRSRLRHRTAEIGVRRAFGARRIDIISQLFGENFLITVIGGLIGLLLSLIFIVTVSNYLFTYTAGYELSLEVINTRPDMGMAFRWNTFLIALGFCLVLNILSATVPAWKASLTEPAEALSAR